MLDAIKLRNMIEKRGLSQRDVVRGVHRRGGRLTACNLNRMLNPDKPYDPRLSTVEYVAAVLQCSVTKIISTGRGKKKRIAPVDDPAITEPSPVVVEAVEQQQDQPVEAATNELQ